MWSTQEFIVWSAQILRVGRQVKRKGQTRDPKERNISKTAGDRDFVPKDTRKWPMGNRIVTSPMAPRDLERSDVTPIRLESPISRK